MKLNNKFTTLAVLGSTMSLVGCGTATELTLKTQERVNAQTETAFNDSQTKVSQIKDAKDPMANFGYSKKNWVNPKPLPKNVINENNLPVFFKEKVSIVSPGRTSLVEIVSEFQRDLAAKTSVRFDIAHEVYSSNAIGGQAQVVSSTGKLSADDKETEPVYINDFVYNGTLQHALDLLAAKANVSWEWKNNTIRIFKYETKTYNIAALAGKLSTNNAVTMTGAASGDSQQGSTTDNSNSQGLTKTSSLTRWDEVSKYILSMMSPNGTYAPLESAGLVSVTDTPSVHKTLEVAISDLNKIISQPIYMNVNIYAVTKNDVDSYGIDWNLAWGTANNKWNLGYQNAGNTGTTGNLTIGLIKGPWSGSSVMINALSSLGKASIVNEFALTTLNGSPVPISTNRRQGYIQSVKTSTNGDGEAPSVEVEQGAVYAGTNLIAIPKIQPNGSILLDFSMNLNDIQEIVDFTTGSGDYQQTVQIPNTTQDSISQTVSLQSGQTLVLSGLKQTTATSQNSGVGKSTNYLLGGKRNANAGEKYLVITVTPFIAEAN